MCFFKDTFNKLTPLPVVEYLGHLSAGVVGAVTAEGT